MADQPVDRAAAGGGKATQISDSVVAQVVRGLATTLRSVLPSTWFGPNQPLQPIAQQVEGRQWDYPVGYNLRLVPKDSEGITFAQLRQLADGYDILRLLIERRKDQMVQMRWDIKAIDPDQKVEDDPRVQELRDFFKVPDGRVTWQTWLRMLLEDMLVCDNAAVYPRFDNGPGKPPSKLELICGDTIKPIIDATGRTPAPPDVAYQQILKGIPAADYSADALVYCPRNRRTNKVYGYGYVEQVLMTVNIALRRQISQLQYFTEGSVPNLLISAPKEWNPDQIAKFNKWFQEKLAGDTGARRQATFIPDGSKPFDTKDAVLKDMFDEWLVRVVCFAFSVSPQPFVKETNRATAETAKEAATEEGLIPIMQWVKDVMDLLIWKYWGYRDLQFGWDEEESIDPLVQAQIDDYNVKNGTKSVDEVRQARGDEPLGCPQMIYLATGPVLLSTLIHQAKTDPTGELAQQKEDQARADDLEIQRTKAQGAQGAGDVPTNGGSGDSSGGGDKGAAGAAPAPAAKPAADEAGKYLGSALLRKSVKRGVKGTIDRDRPEIRRLRGELKSAAHSWLKAAARQAVAPLRAAAKADAKYPDAQPKDTDGPTVQDILDQLDLDGLAVVPDDLQDLIEQIYRDGAAEAFAHVSVIADQDSLDQVSEKAVAYAQDRAAEMVGANGGDYAIDDATREMLRGDIAQAIEEGLSNDDLADVLVDSYGFSADRAETIARTETAEADVQGNLASYQESGVQKKRWVVGDGCCDVCQELDGEEVAIDDVFSDGSDGPPQHPNCRCDVLPVFDDGGDGSDGSGDGSDN